MDAIRRHPFFTGVDWELIRQIEAPFIPRLRSITDTSYFPTEELEQVPEEPAGTDAAGSNKDLAFLGCVLSPALLPVKLEAHACVPLIRADTRSSGSRSRRRRSDGISSLFVSRLRFVVYRLLSFRHWCFLSFARSSATLPL